MAVAIENRTHQLQTTLAQNLGLKNSLAAPRLVKITVNVGLGELHGNEAFRKAVEENLRLITGQKPLPTRAKKAIAGFKLREGDHIGYRITLRSQRMYDFLDRLITYVFPRIRDFQGMPVSGFDHHGNYSFGMREHTVFPEVPFTSQDKPHGLQVTITTSAGNDEHGRALLEQLGFPFAKPKT